MGLGHVQSDYTIKGDAFNVYIPPINRKEIISGNNNLDFLNANEDLGASRVDFVFYGQTPSARKRGGVAVDSYKDEILSLIFGKKRLQKID